MNKKMLFKGTLWFLAVVFVVVLTGCFQLTDVPTVDVPPVEEVPTEDAKEGTDEEAPDTDTALTPNDYLALLKTQESHKVSLDDLQKMVSGVLGNTPEGRSVASEGSVVTGVKKLPISVDQNFVGFAGPGRSALAVPETEPVEIYELSVGQPDSESEGFILASNDDRIGNILAISEGSLEDANEEFLEVLNANMQDYIDATIAEYNSITEEEIEAALEKALAEDVEGARAMSSHWSAFDHLDSGNWKPTGQYWSNFSIQKNPLLLTKWGQGTSKPPYDYAYNNYVRYKKGNDRITGCGATAMAQIVAYHNYIKPNMSSSPPAFNISSVGYWSGTYNLSLIRTMQTITNTSSAAARGQVAALMYHLGDLAWASYSSGETSTSIYFIKPAFLSMGYTVPIYSYATDVTETSNSSTIATHTTPGVIKNALNNNRPILIAGFSESGKKDKASGDDDKKKSGHYWVIDGYGSMTTYKEYFYNSQTGQTATVTLNLNNCLMVHCNLGWNGNANGWYIYGIFDTENRTLLEENYSRGNGNYSTDTIVWIPQKS
jgi:hypothetical protein